MSIFVCLLINTFYLSLLHLLNIPVSYAAQHPLLVFQQYLQKNSSSLNIFPTSAIIFITCRNRNHTTNNMTYRGNINNSSVIIFLMDSPAIFNLSHFRQKCMEDVLKTCLEDVSKTSWRQSKCLLGTSVSNHGLLTNLNQYLTNLCFTNLKMH